MRDSYIYLDTSAFAKLVMPQEEGGTALRQYLRDHRFRVSAELLRTEAVRAAMKVSPAHALEAEAQLHDMILLRLDRDLLEKAGRLKPAALRSLDAIHIAAALSLGDEISELVTYDKRMAAVAEVHGLVVASPS